MTGGQQVNITLLYWEHKSVLGYKIIFVRKDYPFVVLVQKMIISFYETWIIFEI